MQTTHLWEVNTQDLIVRHDRGHGRNELSPCHNTGGHNEGEELAHLHLLSHVCGKVQAGVNDTRGHMGTQFHGGASDLREAAQGLCTVALAQELLWAMGGWW